MQAAHDGPFVHQLRAHWQQVANLNAGHRGRHGAECAAVFRRGIGLRIPGFMLARTAAHPKQDDRFFARRRFSRGPRGLFQPQQARERQPGHPEEPGADKTTAVQGEALAKLGASDLVGAFRTHAVVRPV
jgi:hypothetical protein